MCNTVCLPASLSLSLFVRFFSNHRRQSLSRAAWVPFASISDVAQSRPSQSVFWTSNKPHLRLTPTPCSKEGPSATQYVSVPWPGQLPKVR